ncbi:hypothetical protein BGZ83_009077 [Gryganskiella cystojenkinii]|nr:hypothetical protein BGZ83_009077 [Gryganskiella cystojenkinii]
MDIKIVSSITKLANYMPLGSYVIYTALETYSFSLGATPAPVTTIVQTPVTNYTCRFVPGAAFTYTTCSADQSDALVISLAIGFFLAVFLSFLKQVPPGGTPPLAPPDDDSDDEQEGGNGTTTTADQGQQTTTTNSSTQTRTINGSSTATLVQRKSTTTSTATALIKNKKKSKRPPKPRYRWGVVYAEGNYYYLDFGDSHIWGHAALSFVAFGTLSLFSASVSQCLFPRVKPWIFVFTQIILLVICCFIAMFWIDDPSLSIGLMVVPQTDTAATQTSYGYGPPPSPPLLPTGDTTGSAVADSGGVPGTAVSTSSTTTTTYNAATSTSVPMSHSSSTSPNMTMSFYPEAGATSAGLANVALQNTALNSILGNTGNNLSQGGFSVGTNRSMTNLGGGMSGAGIGSGASGAGEALASSNRVVGGSGGLGQGVGGVSRVSLLSRPSSQDLDEKAGEYVATSDRGLDGSTEWAMHSEQDGAESFSVRVEK